MAEWQEGSLVIVRPSTVLRWHPASLRHGRLDSEMDIVVGGDTSRQSRGQFALELGMAVNLRAGWLQSQATPASR